MSIGEKMEAEEIKDAMERLFAGREPREGWLAKCPTINPWRLRVNTVGARREIVIEGTLTSGRFKVKQQPKWPVLVLWMDRKRRFALTARGMRNLGEEEERDVDLDFTVPGEEKADE